MKKELPSDLKAIFRNDPATTSILEALICMFGFRTHFKIFFFYKKINNIGLDFMQ